MDRVDFAYAYFASTVGRENRSFLLPLAKWGSSALIRGEDWGLRIGLLSKQTQALPRMAGDSGPHLASCLTHPGELWHISVPGAASRSSDARESPVRIFNVASLCKPQFLCLKTGLITVLG